MSESSASMSLRDQCVLTANALRNIAQQIPGLALDGSAERAQIVADALHAHADDLMRAASADTSMEVLEALKLAVRALNATPNFDTGLPSDRPRGGKTSYRLIPELETVISKAGGTHAAAGKDKAPA